MDARCYVFSKAINEYIWISVFTMSPHSSATHLLGQAV